MKKLYIVIFFKLLFIYLFVGIVNTYAYVSNYDINEGKNILIELKKELKPSGFTFKDNSFIYGDEGGENTYETISYNGKEYGIIVIGQAGISLGIINKDYIKGQSSSTIGFNDKNFPLEHILYYFEEYKGDINIINGVIKEVNFNGYDEGIKIYPGTKRKYYLNIRYIGDSVQSFIPNEDLVRKYIIKNKCNEKNNEDIDGEESERNKCIYESIKEQYLDANIEIKIIKSPDFIILKKDSDGLDYFEIDLEDNKYSDIGEYSFEFDVLLNGQKKGFKKQTDIIVFEPIILAIGEIGPDGGNIHNYGEDIFVSFDEGVLNKKHKIVYMKSSDGTKSVVYANPPIGDEIRFAMNIKEPSLEIISYNYLTDDSGERYWTFSKSSTSKYYNEDEKVYNNCVSDETYTDSKKYECYKNYMGLWNQNNIIQSDDFSSMDSKLDVLIGKIYNKVSNKNISIKLKYYKSLRAQLQKLQSKYKKGKNNYIVNYLYKGINKQYLIIFKEYILNKNNG